MRRWLDRRMHRKLAETYRVQAMRASRNGHNNEFPSREFWDVETHRYLAAAWEHEQKAS